MKKVRPNAKWFGLSTENLATLESWLFDQHLTYDRALAKARSKVGFTGSRASLQRFYQSKSRERILMDFEESALQASEVGAAPGTETTLRDSAMKLLAQRLLRRVVADGGTDLATLARLVLQSEANENQRLENEIKRESVELRKRRLDFDLTAWQYNTVEQCFKFLPELNQILKEREEGEDLYSENKRRNAIRRRLFGPDIPEPAPENDEEAKALRDAKDKWGHLWQDAYEDALRRIKLREQYGDKPKNPTPAPVTTVTPPPVVAPEPAKAAPVSEAVKTEKTTVQAEASKDQTAFKPVTGQTKESPALEILKEASPPPPRWEDHEPANRLPLNHPAVAAEWNEKIRNQTTP